MWLVQLAHEKRAKSELRGRRHTSNPRKEHTGRAYSALYSSSITVYSKTSADTGQRSGRTILHSSAASLTKSCTGRKSHWFSTTGALVCIVERFGTPPCSIRQHKICSTATTLYPISRKSTQEMPLGHCAHST